VTLGDVCLSINVFGIIASCVECNAIGQQMEVIHRCRTFSIIANLNKLESFILHDPTAQRLYQQYLALAYPDERKANHIPFFADIVDLGEKGNCSKANTTFRAELYLVFEKYIAGESDLLLDIPNERLDQVRRNIQKDLTLSAFKPAIKAVVRDLAFIHMDRCDSIYNIFLLSYAPSEISNLFYLSVSSIVQFSGTSKVFNAKFLDIIWN
jgi:hypothetical protein